MVRTRSGRASTKKENDETPIKQVSPKKVSPKKVTIKSPVRVKTQKVGWAYGILIDLCFVKPTDKTFTFWSCLQGLIILGIAGYSVFDELNIIYPGFYFYQFILAVHAFDLLTNFCNELVGNGHLNEMILFTETMCNISEVYLFLFMINQASNLWITVVALISFYILALNMKFKNEDKIWVRVVTYLVLFMCLGLNCEFVMNDIRISAYASFVFASMVFDAFDFPDKFVNLVPMCEGLVIFSRAAAVYMLITSQLIANKDAEFTSFESTIKGFIGMQ